MESLDKKRHEVSAKQKWRGESGTVRGNLKFDTQTSGQDVSSKTIWKYRQLNFVI